jgi:hypothetical protein
VSRSIVHIASVLDNRADATAGGPERDLGAFFKQLIKGNRKKK